MSVNRHVKVESSNIKSIGYDRGANVLEVVFSTDPNVMYRYSNITPDVFAEMFNAESIGGFFSKSIRPFSKDHPFERVVASDLAKSVK